MNFSLKNFDSQTAIYQENLVRISSFQTERFFFFNNFGKFSLRHLCGMRFLRIFFQIFSSRIESNDFQKFFFEMWHYFRYGWARFWSDKKIFLNLDNGGVREFFKRSLRFESVLSLTVHDRVATSTRCSIFIQRWRCLVFLDFNSGTTVLQHGRCYWREENLLQAVIDRLDW